MKKKTVILSLLKLLALLGTVSYLGFALVRLSPSTGEMVCTGVDIVFEDSADNLLITPNDVRHLLMARKIAPKGMRYADINMREIDSLLCLDPYIDTVTTYHTSSGMLTVRVRPLKPILHVLAQSGDEFYLEREGRILPAGGQNTNLCIVTGAVSRRFASQHLVELGTLLCEDPYWSLQAQQVNVTPRGELELVPRTGDHLLLLGEPRDIAAKLERIRLFYAKGLPRAGWNRYKSISAEFEGQIVCTKK